MSNELCRGEPKYKSIRSAFAKKYLADINTRSSSSILLVLFGSVIHKFVYHSTSLEDTTISLTGTPNYLIKGVTFVKIEALAFCST